jgi:hypothetical protein
MYGGQRREYRMSIENGSFDPHLDDHTDDEPAPPDYDGPTAWDESEEVPVAQCVPRSFAAPGDHTIQEG